MKSEGDFVEALGVKDGLIQFVGTSEEAKKLESKERLDLKGKTMLPGMVDAHMHLYAYCQNQTFVDLQKASSIKELIDLMTEKKETTPNGHWIKGVNFDQSKFTENRFPTRFDLDQISKEHPIVIKRCCLHAVVANTMALERVGIVAGDDSEDLVGDDSKDHVEDGVSKELSQNSSQDSNHDLIQNLSKYESFIDKGDDGTVNGIVREEATKLFDDIMPDPLNDHTLKREIMSGVMKDMSAKGMTGIHTYAAKIWQYNEDINLYKDMSAEGNLPLRVTVCLDELFDLPENHESDKKKAHNLVQMGAYKLFTDGSLGSRSAYLKAPYSDDENTVGVTVCSQEDLNKKVSTAYKKGLQPAIHAIGDGALDMTLTAIEKCLEEALEEGMTESEQAKRLPFRIIHVQMIDEELLVRMKKLPVILDIQPVFLGTDLHWIEDRLGPKRMKNAYTWKTLLNHGFIQTGGSDCPVESYDPLKGVFAAVERTDTDHYPAGGFYPEEKLSVYEALSLFTVNPPYATGQEDVLGTLEIGKFADMVVLDENPFEIETRMIKDIQVLWTFVAGSCVYRRM